MPTRAIRYPLLRQRMGSPCPVAREPTPAHADFLLRSRELVQHPVGGNTIFGWSQRGEHRLTGLRAYASSSWFSFAQQKFWVSSRSWQCTTMVGHQGVGASPPRAAVHSWAKSMAPPWYNRGSLDQPPAKYGWPNVGRRSSIQAHKSKRPGNGPNGLHQRSLQSQGKSQVKKVIACGVGELDLVSESGRLGVSDGLRDVNVCGDATGKGS